MPTARPSVIPISLTLDGDLDTQPLLILYTQDPISWGKKEHWICEMFQRFVLTKCYLVIFYRQRISLSVTMPVVHLF